MCVCVMRLMAVLACTWTLGSGQGNMDPRVNITETVPSDNGKYVVKGFIAQDVTLTCFVENLVDDRDVRWQVITRGNDKPKLISVNMDIQDNNKWSIEKPTSYKWRLRIKALEVADEGNYTCFVQLNIDARVLANRTVLAYEKPAFVESAMASDVTVKEGEKQELMCDASGRPAPTILWRREGNAILPNGGVVQLGGHLSIKNAQYEHRGTYMCRIVNEMGEDVRRIFVQVQFSPKMRGEETVSQAVGYMRTIICYVEANPQPNKETGSRQLYWTKGNRGVPETDRIKYRVLEGAYSRLIFELIFTVVTEEDFGTYECNAANNLGNQKKTFILTKSDTPVPDKGGLISAATATYSHLVAQTGTILAALVVLYNASFL